MRAYERSAVTLDRCTECGGIFLDRGELERLIEAEGQFNAERGWSGKDERGWGDDEEPRRGRRRRGGFLGDLLDFG